MDRSRSDDHIAFGPATPWDSDVFARAPRAGNMQPCVPQMEKAEVSAFRSVRSNSAKAPRPTSRSVTSRSGGSRHRATSPPEDSSYQHRMPSSSSARTTPRPNETFTFMPQAVQTAPDPPPICTKVLPATPESFSDNSKTSTDKSLSPYSEQVVQVLPGTMAARTGRTKPSSRHRPVGDRRKRKPTKMSRMRSAFTGLFLKDPVDENQLEKIQGKHWAED